MHIFRLALPVYEVRMRNEAVFAYNKPFFKDCVNCKFFKCQH